MPTRVWGMNRTRKNKGAFPIPRQVGGWCSQWGGVGLVAVRAGGWNLNGLSFAIIKENSSLAAAGLRVVIKTEEPHSDDCPEDLEQHQMSGSSEGDFQGLDQDAPCESPYSATPPPPGNFAGNSLEEARDYVDFGEIKRVTVQHGSSAGKALSSSGGVFLLSPPSSSPSLALGKCPRPCCPSSGLLDEAVLI